MQAVLDSPIFETRWRWTTTLALAVPRNRNGARVPAQIQRMYAEDLLQAVFPDAAACLDNIQGAREVPDHPLVNQAMRDALEEAMDLPRLMRSPASASYAGEIQCLARDTPEPSVFCHELLNSAVYTFLDDAPLEERRTQAVYTRRATEPRNADDLGALDPAAIERVRDEAWPVANTRRRAARRAAARRLHPRRRSRDRQAHGRALRARRAGRAVTRAGSGCGRALRGAERGRAAAAPGIPERLRKSGRARTPRASSCAAAWKCSGR